MESESLIFNVFEDKDQLVVKTSNLSNLPETFPFYNSIRHVIDFEVISDVEGEGLIIKQTKNQRPRIISKRTFELRSKAGNTAYFDANLVDLFKTEHSALYLPVTDNSISTTLVIEGNDTAYIVFPCEIYMFTPYINNWI